MVSVCAGLVTFDEESDVIRLVYYTMQEYCERTWIFWFPDAQRDIAMVCVTYLLFHTFQTGSCLTGEDFEARLRLNPLYGYSGGLSCSGGFDREGTVDSGSSWEWC